MRRFTAIAMIGLLVLALVGGAVSAIVLVTRGAPDPEPIDEAGPSGLERFYSQDVQWRDCRDYRCATVTVPVDYADPGGETLQLAVRRVPATGDGGGAIFANPGGPGGSAQTFVGYLAAQLPDDLRRTHDVIGVDPRGVGESTPLQCLSDEQFDEFIDVDPDPEPSDVEALTEAIVEMGEACRANSGALAAHVSTEETARDHDIVRALVGQEKMTWFGFSYGTQLGATYADLFPERVEAMVLDGAVDVSLDSTAQSLGQAEGFQRALESFLSHCVDQKSCPVGDTVEAGMSTITDLMSRLSDDPIDVGSRQLSQGRAFYGIAMALYSQETWQYLTTALRQVLDGDGTILLLLSDTYFERKQDGSFANNSGQVIYAINCLDTDDAPGADQMPALLPRFRAASPVFGGALGWGAMACHDWPIESTHPQQPVKAAGAPPILVVGTTRDPATPYAWSEAMASQLESGVLLTREGDGHTAYTSGNACIRDAVNAYLRDGTVPADGTVCAEE